MKEEYLLTVSIPTYNGGKTIENLLKILLSQYDNRVQIFISDNASNDNTQEIIFKYIKKYPFIEYIRNERNIGPDSNYLQCMTMAKGKYIHLLSDDDILAEGMLKEILEFLSVEEVSLVYLNTVGFHEIYEKIEKCEKYKGVIYDNRTFVTKDKKKFMKYAFRLWGFLSSFIILKEAFDSIQNVESYKRTNWLQTYIFTECSMYGKQKLGVISKPCIAAGIYSTIFNYDSGKVNGESFRKLCNFAIESGFDKKQMDYNYIWHVCYLSKRALIKERAAGVKKTTVRELFKNTWNYLYAWIHLFPYFFIPPFICKLLVKLNNKRKGYHEKAKINRNGDVVG